MSLFTFLRDLFIMDRLFRGHRDDHERDLNHNHERDHNHKQKQKNNHHNKQLPVMYMNNMKSYGNGRRRGDIVDDDLDEDMAYDLVDDLFDD